MSSQVHVIFLHGFNVPDEGKSGIAQLMPYFAAHGCQTEMLPYGRFGLLDTRFGNPVVAQQLAARIVELTALGHRCIVVAHSNGCTITHLAGDLYGAPIEKVVYLNAALNRGIRFPASFGSFDVWHNPKDKAVRAARLRPFSLWGDMGAVGFTRFDRRGKNYNMLTNYDLPSRRHGSIFKEPALSVFGPIIAARALNLPRSNCNGVG